jgi:hypothetical protein
VVRPEQVERDGEAAVPLVDWTWPEEGIVDEATDAAEHYGYNASWRVLHALVGEIGPDEMREVLQAADESEIAYVGAADPELHIGRNDWGQLEILDERAEAREDYAELVEAADGWEPPMALREPMAYWQFDEFGPVAEQGAAVLTARDLMFANADELDLDPPASLEAAWHGSHSDFDRAAELVERQQDGLDAIEEAAAAVAAPRDVFASIGLWDATPETDLAEAREAWEADRDRDVMAETEAVEAILAAAPEIGRTRVLIGVGIGIGVFVLLVVLFLVVRRARRRPPAPVAATAAYATLPAQSPGGNDETTDPADLSDPPARSDEPA